MRHLFLIADTGGGHRASAIAVAGALARRQPGVHEVTLLDPFREASPLAGGTAGLYGPLTRRGRWVWGMLWHATNSAAAVRALNAGPLRLVDRAIRRRITALQPDSVVSFHPLLNHAMVRAVRSARPGTRTLTVVTDLVGVHASWVCPGVDAVVVATPDGVDRCRRSGMDAGRCYALGLPVDERFTEPPPDDAARRGLRGRLGLDPERFTVLVCGGADGSGGLVRAARAVATCGADVQVAVICGRNRGARARLEALRPSTLRLRRVEGFVRNMPEWLRAADVVVTKAGPGTLAEALCCGLPILVTSYLPGQERGNVSWLTTVGAGRFVPRTAQLAAAVRELSAEGSPALVTLREAARAAARPDASARIAALVEATVAGAGQPATVTPGTTMPSGESRGERRTRLSGAVRSNGPR